MRTIDLYHSDISDFEKTQYLMQIKVLREYMNKSESLSSAEIDFLTNNFSTLISLVPSQPQLINSFSLPFERLVINQYVIGKNARLDSLANLRYPPLADAHGLNYNRASMKGKSIFYAGSMGPLPITIEVQPKVGQLISTSKWKFNAKRDLKLIVICYSLQTALKNPNELLNDYNAFNRCLMQMQPNNKTVVSAVTEFIEEAFTRKVSPDNKQGYIMSALIADYFFHHSYQPVDAIYYPSVPNDGSSANIAIKPEVVDELFDMIEVSESIVCSDPSNGRGGWLSFGTAKCTTYDKDSLELKWEQLHVPDNHPIHELIKSHDIKLD